MGGSFSSDPARIQGWLLKFICRIFLVRGAQSLAQFRIEPGVIQHCLLALSEGTVSAAFSYPDFLRSPSRTVNVGKT